MSLKSCRYCGRVHDSRYDCGKRPIYTKGTTSKDKFRWTQAWKDKREEIKSRDHYMCQVCIRKLYGYDRQYNYEGIQVHHIDSLEYDFDRRLDNDNLISLCSFHHEMAEKNEIKKKVLFDIVRDQEHPPCQ